MSNPRRIVIVGTGLAGAAAARTLREDGFDGQVVLVGAEHHPPYERPPLSKDYLRGESRQSDAYVEPEQYWAQHDVELRAGVAARRIDLADARLELADGSAVGFDRLLLAPGAAPRTLAVPGCELAGIVALRSFEDADFLRARVAAAERILVVGGGWVAAEVAASLRMLGHQVTVALRGRAPLEAALGAGLAEVYRGLHEEHEVTFMPGTRVVAFDGESAVRRAQTAAGAWLDADLVVVAIGVEPRTDLARNAGLAVADGIAVNAQLATSDPRVFAAGDAALVPHPTLAGVLRVEHWGAALAQGAHAARAMLGDSTPYDALPYYFSDQYDTGMEFWGDPSLPGEMAVRGELDTRSFTAFWHQEGRVTAVLNMHVHHHAHGDNDDSAGHGEDQTSHPHDTSGGDGHASGHVDPAAVERLIRSGAPIRIESLKDPDVPLDALVDAERTSSRS
jgi:3-phenylpropionate/trans-cinnamate dioxygenase ferredoxin reductase subunit